MNRRHVRTPWAGPLGLYRPGRTPVHRASAGVKLALLGALGLAVVVLRGIAATLGVLAAVLALAAVARLPWRRTARSLVPVVVTALLLAAYQWWTRDWAVGLEVAVDLVSLVLAATVVTATTSTDVLLDVVAHVARPLRHVGLRPEVVSMATGVVLRAIPVLVGSTLEARDAARARGLGRSPRAVLVPAAVRMVGHGMRTGEALAARGLVD